MNDDYESGAAKLEADFLAVRDRHATRMLSMEFDGFMKKLNRLSREQQITLFNALVERLAA